MVQYTNGNSAEKPMTTQTVHFDNFDVELSQPLDDRQNVVLITTSDGRRSVIGDGQDLFTIDEYRQIDRLNFFDGRGQSDS